MCYPCVRTSVTLVSGLKTQQTLRVRVSLERLGVFYLRGRLRHRPVIDGRSVVDGLLRQLGNLAAYLAGIPQGRVLLKELYRPLNLSIEKQLHAQQQHQVG